MQEFKSIDWATIQNKSDILLNVAKEMLLSSASYPLKDIKQINPACAGVYYILDPQKRHSYVGEAKELSKRLKQQSTKNTSTFYKTYSKVFKGNLKDIDEFFLKYICLNIARKELEEFCMVNIPTSLNKSHKNKRKLIHEFNHSNHTDIALWDFIQIHYTNVLIDGESKLVSFSHIPWNEARPPSRPGVYSISHDQYGLLYIGETSNLLQRYSKAHSKSTYISAFRRNLGQKIFGYELKVKNGKRRYFTKYEESSINKFILESYIRFIPVSFGRLELEEYLIGKYQPILNRKSKNSK